MQEYAGLVLALLCQRTFLQARIKKQTCGESAKTAVTNFLAKRQRID